MENTIKTRYDYLEESTCEDPVDREPYFDPLSKVFRNEDIIFSKAPVFEDVSKVMVGKYWKYFYDKYGTVDNQDLLLSINAIPYLGQLTTGSILAFPQMEDMTSNYKKPN